MSEAQQNSPAADQECETEKIIDITLNTSKKEDETKSPTEPIVMKSPQQNNSQPGGDSTEEKTPITDPKNQLIEFSQEATKKGDIEESQKDKSENNGGSIEKTDKTQEEEKKATTETDQTTVIERPDKEKTASVGTSTIPVTETPEVSSTKNDEPPRNVRSSRRASYNNGGRNYGAGYGYQNYGLTYLPYKSNFEPSEDARRRADEFFKTLKL